MEKSHPIAALFFLLFRVGALLTYLLGSIFTDNFTLIFVLTILFLAFDFWTTKNISGRLLVGLRWWNEIQPDGSNKWVFESANVSILSLIHKAGSCIYSKSLISNLKTL